ncbi:hypothetical protein DL765_007084 [Monosporascus sp. GIB2]|nr:hypothetical protein DL765_007084 [Monosporascus sp. GIB2]
MASISLARAGAVCSAVNTLVPAQRTRDSRYLERTRKNSPPGNDLPNSTFLDSFKNWEIGQEARKIIAETLPLNGKYYEATDVCMGP